MYAGHTVVVRIRSDRRSHVLTAPSVDQQSIQTPMSRELTGQRMLSTNYHRGVIVSQWIFPPLSISSHHLPLTPPPSSIPLVNQYAQTERFLPSSSSWHPMFFEKVKRTQIWRWKHILCVQTTDSVPRNLEIWVLFLVIFGFLKLFSDVAPHLPFFFFFFFLLFLSLFFAASPNEMAAYLRGVSPWRR